MEGEKQMYDNMAISLLMESEQPGPIKHFPLPSDRREMATAFFSKTVTVDSGEVYRFDFNFIPQPTWEEFCSYIPHTCETCEWSQLKLKGTFYCPTPEQGSPCPDWELSSEAYKQAELSYYTVLHEQHYGKAE